MPGKQIAGRVDDTAPESAAEGVEREVRVSPEGNLLVELMWGNAALHQAASVDVNASITADVEPAVAAATGLRLVGWSAKESAGSAAIAEADIMNGASQSGGTVVSSIAIAASRSEQAWYGPEGIDCANGITIDHIAGQLDIAIYYKTIT